MKWNRWLQPASDLSLLPRCQVVYEDSRMVGLKAPYVSGFLAFREVPFLVELVQRLQEKEPDLMPQVGAS
jgi:deoxyinosine 3'endonuclease (endonuclease V)